MSYLLPDIAELEKKIFDIKSDEDFNKTAFQVFHFQLEHNVIYKQYVSSLGTNLSSLTHYSQIPCLPISFFKTQNVVCGPISEDVVCFQSSGTTGSQTSKHFVKHIELYEKSFTKGFELFYGSPSDFCILALLPSYLERKGSSLVYMFDSLIKQSKHSQSGFFLNNYNDLIETLNFLKQSNQKTLLIGVTYALLDLAEKHIELFDNLILMETGGMKGKRKEMVKEELYTFLSEKLHVSSIHSEYGMTELLSQAYSKGNGIFNYSPWMRILIRDTNDPFAGIKVGKTGGINVIDLANLYSCSFIETKDLGKLHQNHSFEIIGRFDNSDIRGCNLLIQ